jgi:hypothetical protein
MKTDIKIASIRTIVLACPFFLISVSAPVVASNADNVDEILEESLEGEALVKNKGQWVPVPMIVSNPTVGTGLQAVLMYLHPEQPGSTHNVTTGLVGMYTDTSSWFTGVFHDDSFMDDRFRISGFLGTGTFYLDYYGIGDITGDKSIPYEFNMNVATVKLQARIPETSHWFAGVLYIFLSTDSEFKTSDVIPGLPNIIFSDKTAGLGVLVAFDSRNNNYYPTEGQWAEVKWTDYSETWGGDHDYNKTTAFINHYQPATEQLTLVLRTRLESSSGDVPYYDLPTLQMGGFSRDRYRDYNTWSFHTEGRYKFQPRWGVIGFYEFGWFNKNLSDIFSGDRVVSYGTGVRWHVTEKQQMNLGIDAAFSGAEKAIYIKIGERF